MTKLIDENWLYAFRNTLLNYRDASRKYHEALDVKKKVLLNDTTNLEILKEYCGDWHNTRRDVQDAFYFAEQGKIFQSRYIAEKLLDEIINSHKAYKLTEERNLINRLHSIKFFDTLSDNFIKFFNMFLIDEYIYKTDEQIFKETQDFLDKLKRMRNAD